MRVRLPLPGLSRRDALHFMNIAYVTTYDSTDIRRWSGTGFHIGKSIEDAGLKVFRIGDLRPRRTLVNGIAHLWHSRVRGKRDHAHRHPSVLRSYADQVSNRLDLLAREGNRIDAILSPGTLPVAYLETDIPIAIWTDCTFASMVGYYQSWTNLSARSLRMGHDADRRGLRKAARLIFASEWAARSAVDDYQCDRRRIDIVPLGANVEGGVSAAELETLIPSRLAGPVRLLLIGVDWERKGCEFAIDVLHDLRRRGLPAQLDIVGCLPPTGFRVPDGVTCHGFMNKRDPADVAKLRQLLTESTMLALPTKAECQGIVFNEAAAFGLPVIAPDTGGVGSVVRNGVTGLLLGPTSNPLEWAASIATLCSDHALYRRYARTALAGFDDRLSWLAAASRVAALLRSVQRI